MLRLGVNVDHIATLRNARGGECPDPLQGAIAAIQAGAHGITAHLREDRRHVCDRDMYALKAGIEAPLNFEMAATEEMMAIAESVRPNACCLVPEKREEVTTEGGLNVTRNKLLLAQQVQRIKVFDARVSLFIDPKVDMVQAAADVGADIVEFHTGELAHAYAADPCPLAEKPKAELARLQEMSTLAASLGLEVHGGHGLNYDTARMVAEIPEMQELNIGHFLMGEALFIGLPQTISKMLSAMAEGRSARG